MSKPKNPCKACEIRQLFPSKKPCLDQCKEYALYLAELKIAAIVRTIKSEECSKCYRMDDENCYGCKWYKFTKKAVAYVAAGEKHEG